MTQPFRIRGFFRGGHGSLLWVFPVFGCIVEGVFDVLLYVLNYLNVPLYLDITGLFGRNRTSG